MSKPGKELMMKSKHSSLDLSDVPELLQDAPKKDSPKTKIPGDIWWNKLTNLGDVLKKNPSNDKKSKTQTTLDYFLKSKPRDIAKTDTSKSDTSKRQIKVNGRPSALQKQMSVGSYPILLNIPEEATISRDRPATICGGNAEVLERPRKKLSFREPEITGYSRETLPRKNNIKPFNTPQLPRSNIYNGMQMQKWSSYEDLDLESQAMRVVRTIGQAFEVCHKLSITGPNPDEERQDDEEGTQLSQDLHSDICASDKPTNLHVKKDTLSEDNLSDRGSFLSPEENCGVGGGSVSDSGPPDRPKPPLTLDILPPPPPNNSSCRRSDMSVSETYVSPLTEPLRNAAGTLPAAGSALSAHHELQLLREQLEQQTQQTQAALGQIQLLRDQLAAEQAARLEAQARTHQLLVHNKELLDHITALVSHLQDNERTGGQGHTQPPAIPHVTMVPQQLPGLCDPYDRSESSSLDQSPVLQALGLIENRTATTCLPPSPLRTTFGIPPYGEHQLLQRIQSLYGQPPNLGYGYPPPAQYGGYQYPYSPQPNLAQMGPMNTSTYTLAPPPQKKLTPSPLSVRHQFQTSPNRRPSPDRRPSPVRRPSPDRRPQKEEEAQFIRPLSQVGTLTTTDYDGRVRVIVPVASGAEDAGDLLRALRINDDYRQVQPIQRTTSEKVPNRSELMSQVQRTAWARHTTK